MKRLLLVGGGHSHIEVLRRCGLRPLAGVEITIVNPSRYAAYSGMLPGLIAGHYQSQECHIDLARVACFARAKLLSTWARAVDPERREIALADGSTVSYDILAINVGAALAPPAFSSDVDNLIPVKPVETFLRAWDALMARAQAGALQKIAVVGAGAAGVELLLAMQYRLSQIAGPHTVRFVLASDDSLLPGHNSRVQARFQSILEAQRVEMHFSNRVTSVAEGALVCASGLRIPADAFVWATGGTAAPSLPSAGLARDEAGFIAVNNHLQSPSHQTVFAAGDCATVQGHRHPKSGVYAVRQGPLLAENLRRTLDGKPLADYRPQRHALALISSGGRHAVASYGPLALSGAWVWRRKDRIDRGFVARYNTLD